MINTIHMLYGMVICRNFIKFRTRNTDQVSSIKKLYKKLTTLAKDVRFQRAYSRARPAERLGP